MIHLTHATKSCERFAVSVVVGSLAAHAKRGNMTSYTNKGSHEAKTTTTQKPRTKWRPVGLEGASQ